jgi:hypothetical protein
MPDDPRFANHIKDVWPSLTDLFAAGENVRGLMAHPGWADIFRLIEAQVAEIDRALDGASTPKTQAEYAMEHGRRDGLFGYLRAAQAIVGRADKKLEEQRQRHEGDAEPSPVGST